MVKTNAFLLLATICMLLVIPAVSAVQASIIIKTDPFHDLFVQVANPNSQAVIQSVANSTNLTGEIQFDFTTTQNIDEVTFFIVKRLFGEVVDETWVNDVPIENDIYVNLLPEEEEAEEESGEETETSEEESGEEESGEETETETEEGTETSGEEGETGEETETTEEITEETADGAGVTGNVVAEETGSSISASTIYYLTGAVVLVIIILIVFFIARVKMSMPSSGRKSAVIVQPKQDSGSGRGNDSIEKELEDAERKIKEAREEIRRLKSKNSEVEQAEEEFRRAKQKLERLKGPSTESDDDRNYSRFQDKS